jgi:quercetin dioxygenase-like cupin family protein
MSTPAQKTTITKKSFGTPDETRDISKGKVEVLNLGDTTAMRATFEPGWRWSESVKPIAGTESCEVAHLVYVISGRMGLKMNDGTETEIGPGDVASIPPGHDAWIIGNEPCVALDFQGGGNYAK